MKQITLLLSGKKGYSVLKAIVERGTIESVVTVFFASDPRIQKDFYFESKDLCGSVGLKFLDSNEYSSTHELTEIVVAIGWRKMLPARQGIVIFHDSLLPRYRGFAPLVAALIEGERVIGASAILAADNYDRGKIIAQKAFNVSYPIKISEALDIMCNVYVELFFSIFDGCALSVNDAVVQIESDVTYSLWRDDLDYWINWKWSSEKILRFINAVGFPYYGSLAHCNGIKVVVRGAETYEDVEIVDRESHIGKVIFLENNCPVVVCGSGLLKLIEVNSLKGNSILPLARFRTRFYGNSEPVN